MANPTARGLAEFLDYDFQSGILVWKPRKSKWFRPRIAPPWRECKRWNTRYAGKDAGVYDRLGYCHIKLFKRKIAAHHIIWTICNGYWPSGVIDHINGDPSDNRIENLRNVSQLENNKNARRRSDNNSGVTGVCFSRNRWLVRYAVNGVNRHVGYFDSFDDAVRARVKASAENNFHENHGRVCAF